MQDQEKIQFAADLRTPDRDGTALYVLTSKFHRFFLKNLDANEFNTRILRIDGVAIPSGQLATQSHLRPTVPYDTLHGNAYYHPSVVLPVPYKPLGPVLPPAATTSNPLSVFNTQNMPFGHGLFTKQSTFGHSTILQQGKPSQPFFALNNGEKSFPPSLGSRPQYGASGSPIFVPKLNQNFNDLNLLRYRKSVPVNQTALH